MESIKSIADFKRTMVVGTFWEATHQFLEKYTPTKIKDLGIRKCVCSDTVKFGFFNEKVGGVSYCDWPNKKSFSVENNVVIIQEDEFCKLTYKQVEK